MKSILKDPKNSERLLNLISGTLILMDKDGVCVDIATRDEKLWFMKEEILLGKNLLEALPPGTFDKFHREFTKVLSCGTKSDRNYELRMKDGTYYFKCLMQPYDDLVLCQYRDITDIQRMRNESQLLTRAIDNSMEDIYAAQEDGTLLFANRCFKKRHRIGDKEDLSRIKIYELPTYGRDRQSWEEFASNVKQGTYKNGYIVHHPLPEHPEVLAIEGNTYYVADSEGTGAIWTFGKDVTKRIRREQEVKQLNKVLDNTIDNLPAGIVVKDINNNFKYIYRNRESYNRNVTKQEAAGKDDFDFHSPEIAAQKRKEDIEVATTGREKHWVVEECDGNGNPIFLDKRKIKIEGNDFPPILLSIEWDITEMELMKRELMVAKEKAETSDRLKSAFLANMSHEIRTPLNAIIGFSRIIAESDSREERKTYYDIVAQNDERLLQLINEILDLSKIEAGIMEFCIAKVHLHPLCKEIYQSQAPNCPAGVQLIFEPSDEQIRIDADRSRLFQVITHLVNNSFKFTEQGSVSYGYRREGDHIVFHVTDTGTGIAPEKIGKVFDRFVKADSFVQGTGLGLPICKAIVERLGGTISVTSELGKGTTFSFSLPASTSGKEEEEKEMLEEAIQSDGLTAEEQEIIAGEMEKTPAAEKSPVKESGETAKKTVLVAEDTDCNYILAKAILRDEYLLERAKDGVEAVNMFEEIQPDIILMDMRMPNLNGLDATRIIRELSPTVPIVALTAFADEEDHTAALEAGCNDVMTKPFTQEKLKETIRKWIS